MQGRGPQATGAKTADCMGRQSCKPCGVRISKSPEQNRQAMQGRGQQCRVGARKPLEQKRQAIRGRDRQATEVGIDKLPGQNRRAARNRDLPKTHRKKIDPFVAKSCHPECQIRIERTPLQAILSTTRPRQRTDAGKSPAYGIFPAFLRRFSIFPTFFQCEFGIGRPSIEHDRSWQDVPTHGRTQPRPSSTAAHHKTRPCTAGRNARRMTRPHPSIATTCDRMCPCAAGRNITPYDDATAHNRTRP